MSDKPRETLEQFLARGGIIKKVECKIEEQCIDSRFKEKDIWRHSHNVKARVRIDKYKKQSGGKLPRDMKMYLAFARKFGI